MHPMTRMTLARLIDICMQPVFTFGCVEFPAGLCYPYSTSLPPGKPGRYPDSFVHPKHCLTAIPVPESRFVRSDSVKLLLIFR